MWKQLDGGDWTAEQADRWNEAHLPEVSAGERIDRTWRHFLSHPSLLLARGMDANDAMELSSLYGTWLWVLCWPVFFTRRRGRWDWLLLVTAGGQMAFWAAVSHVPGRFIVPAVLPLGLLVGRSLAAFSPAVRGALLILLLAPALVSGIQLQWRFDRDTLGGQPGFFHCEQAFMDSPQPFLGDTGPLNRKLEQAGASESGPPIVWLIAEARPFYLRYPARYTVVFSRDLLAERLAAQPPAEVRRWLTDQGIRFIYVDWREAVRLRDSYGFPAAYTRRSLLALGRPVAFPSRGAWLIEVGEFPTTREE
jgi:hypothetical protein